MTWAWAVVAWAAPADVTPLAVPPIDVPPLPVFVAPDVPEGVRPCGGPLALTPGRPLPDGLLDDQGRVTCHGVVLGLDLALEYQALSEAYVPLLKDRWTTDTRALALERNWYAARLQDAERPPPIWERPGVARTVGRVEALATVALFLGVGVAIGGGI